MDPAKDNSPLHLSMSGAVALVAVALAAMLMSLAMVFADAPRGKPKLVNSVLFVFLDARATVVHPDFDLALHLRGLFQLGAVVAIEPPNSEPQQA